MKACPHIGNCYVTSDEAGYSPEFARIVRTAYCRREYAACARYRAARALGGPSRVPKNLLPAEGGIAS